MGELVCPACDAPVHGATPPTAADGLLERAGGDDALIASGLGSLLYSELESRQSANGCQANGERVCFTQNWNQGKASG